MVVQHAQAHLKRDILLGRVLRLICLAQLRSHSWDVSDFGTEINVLAEVVLVEQVDRNEQVLGVLTN